jgi:hypothetical protein
MRFTCRRASNLQELNIEGWNASNREKRTQIIEGVENNVKLLEPRDIVLRFLDVVVDGMKLDIGVEGSGGLRGNLIISHS